MIEKIGPWKIDDKSHPGRIFLRSSGCPTIYGELLPENQVGEHDGQFCLGNGLTLKIISIRNAGLYILSDVYETLETALKAYEAAGGKLPTPAFADHRQATAE